MAKSKTSGVFKKVDKFADVIKGVDVLTNTVVMVGVPEDKDQRNADLMSNADLAYIHDKGSAAAGIPARPFMEPGIQRARKQIIDTLREAGKAVMKGGSKKVEAYLHRVGLIASRSIKSVITEGIPPPLAPSTVRGRIYRVKGKKRRQQIKDELAAGTPASRQGGVEGLFTPLVVTGQLRNAITYVLRRQKDVKK